MQTVQDAVTSIKDGTVSTAFFTDNAKTIRNLTLLAGIGVLVYYALNIVATTKRNIKTIKK
ncbi:MAG: hypothetical protein LBP54_02530 [Campylobacteraceae bacterium]|jgi:hypothetical protein|nr:hypothetical protein [Campylobacteraceae bacterium]